MSPRAVSPRAWGDGASGSGSVPLLRSSPPPPTPHPKAHVDPHLIVLGDVGVGKSSVIHVLQGFAASKGAELDVAEASADGASCLSPGGGGDAPSRDALACAVPLLVFNAADGLELGGKTETLKAYVDRHVTRLTQELHGLGGTAREREALVSRLLVLCNKSDVQPCPLPEIAALDAGTVFLAGSATRGTNMRELWRRVETCAAQRPKVQRPKAGIPLAGIPLERSVSLDTERAGDWYETIEDFHELSFEHMPTRSAIAA